MKGLDKLENAEWLESFSHENASDMTFNLYNTLSSDEKIEEFWNKCSDFYHINCFPFDEWLEEWKDIPDIYNVLDQFAHTANGFPLDILICKFNDKSMEEAKRLTEEFRKQYEWTSITIKDPNSYAYMVWFFWGSTWRTAQYIIKELKNRFSNKFRELKVKK